MSTLELPHASYERDREYVLAVLSRRCGWLDGDEREAALHDAYAVLLEKERDGQLDPGKMHPRQLRAYLTQTAVHKALDEGKRVERKRSEPLGDRALAEPDVAARAPEELAASSMENARMREIVGELGERAQAVVKLRFYFDRSPGEIQRCLGISERVYRRELERALKRISERYELVREDRFCDSRRSLILAYVAGIAGPGRMAKAREHLEACPGCARWAAELREAGERAAAVLPLPAVTVDHGPLTRMAESAAALRDGFSEASGMVKQHAGALVARVDPTTSHYAAAARPGTVATVVAGCVALGSGATYCAVEGVPDPVRSLVRLEAKHTKQPDKPRAAQAPEPAPAPPIVTATPEPAPPQTEPQPAPAPEAPAPEPAAPPAPAQEFGLEGSGESSGAASSAPPSSSPPASPSPQPAAPPGEFDP